MVVKVLTFGVAKEICGARMIAVETNDVITVAELRSALLLGYPALSRLTSFMIAVNSKYAASDLLIASGDEVAIIPPVSGG